LIIRIYAQSVHNYLDVTPRVTAVLTINWSKCTALIHG